MKFITTKERKKMRQRRTKNRPKMQPIQMATDNNEIEPMNSLLFKEKSLAEQGLQKALKIRMNKKKRIMNLYRRGGTREEVQAMLKQFNENPDEIDEKMETMKEIQSDVKGMTKKQAKRYMRKVMATMNTEQVEKFTDEVKHMPGASSNELMNFMKSTKKIQKQTEKDKPKINHETVYIPYNLLSDETKLEKMNGRPLKKKKFSHINIKVPKLIDMHNNTGQKTVSLFPPPPKHKLISAKNSTVQDIVNLFN
jgi:hypothetical protein